MFLRFWAPVLAAAGVAAVFSTPAGAAAPSTTGLAASVVSAGAAVQADGQVLRIVSGGYQLCELGRVSWLPGGTDCKRGFIVRLTGSATMLTAAGKTNRASRVTGVYRDNTIHVTSVRRVQPTETFADVWSGHHPTPCARPAGGWKKVVVDSNGLNRVNARIYASPHLYSGSWFSGIYTKSGKYAGVILNVGTTGNPIKVKTALASVYRNAFCVYSVNRSNAQLNNIREQVKRAVGKNLMELFFADPVHNRMDVQVRLVTAQSEAKLRKLGSAVKVAPLIWPTGWHLTGAQRTP